MGFHTVQAGFPWSQSMPFTARPDARRSPNPEPEALQGKYAKKLGNSQWVMPGRIRLLDIFEHRRERLALRGRFGRQRCANLSRLDLRRHGK